MLSLGAILALTGLGNGPTGKNCTVEADVLENALEKQHENQEIVGKNDKTHQVGAEKLSRIIRSTLWKLVIT